MWALRECLQMCVPLPLLCLLCNVCVCVCLLQALSLIPNPAAGAEADALANVKEALSDVQGLSWPSGKLENN